MVIFSKLSKNFKFFESENFKSDWKNKIIEYISLAEELKNYSQSIICLSNVLDLILNDIIEKNKFDVNYVQMKLSEKISYIQDLPRNQMSSYFFSLMREIKNARNHEAHRHTNKVELSIKWTKNDVISKLKNIFIISKTLYGNSGFDNEEFDEEIYYKNSINNEQNKENNISAISDEERKIERKKFAITSEGLKINKDSIRGWLSIKNSKLIVPIYQRRYEWKEENIRTLLLDIEARMNDGEEHYFGTIAQKKKMGEDNNDPNQIKIIDGQQRITTSLLIVSAVRQVLFEKNLMSTDIDWYNEIIENHNSKKLSNYIYNPGGRTKENEVFRIILDNTNGDDVSKLTQNYSSNYYKNYLIAYNFLKDRYQKINEIYNFINTFLSQFQVASINFDNDKFSNKKEMEIFENLNSKGLELSLTDLIKNYIFNFCNDETLNLYETKVPSEYETAIGIIGDNELENFYLTISEFYFGDEIPKEKRTRFNIVKDSLNIFLSNYSNISNINDYENMINFLKQYIYLYNESISDQRPFLKFIGCDKIVTIIKDKKKRRLFSYFNFIIYNVISFKYKHEFDFYHYDQQNFKLSNEDLKMTRKLFLEITKFLIKTKIITKQGDSNIKRLLIKISKPFSSVFAYKNKELKNICEDIISLIKKAANDNYDFQKFKSNLRNNLDTSQVVDLLVLTEKIMGDALFDVGESIDRSSTTVEHIMPQDLKKWIDNETEDDFAENAENYINKLGNYLILTRIGNAKISNDVFKLKKSKLYMNLSSPLYKSSNNYIDVSKKEKWTFEDIDKRTDALIEYITKYVITD